MWRDLSAHLFQQGGAEHGAVLLAGLTAGPRGPRLLARELIIATDGIDYIPGRYGHRALTASFVGDLTYRAHDEGLAYIAVHNHHGHRSVAFSPIDLASHERGYPTLRQITGRVVGGLVLTPQAAAGDLWLPDGTRSALAEVVIPANNLIRLRPRPAAATSGVHDPRRDRQARLFGDLGQETLGLLRVAVAGLGGIGSIVVELLARLGVGHLVLIDDDSVDHDGTNLPRLIAAEPDDIDQPKTVLAERNARRANPNIQLTMHNTRVENPEAYQSLTGCDWIFLAADGAAARHKVNEAVNRYVIPCTQIGVKIPVDPAAGEVGDIHAVTRLIFPGHGCVWCNNLVNSSDLAIDLLPAHERANARYLSEVPAPSVISLNNRAAAEAVDHFMLAATGLHDDDFDLDWIFHRPRTREREIWIPRQNSSCKWCTNSGALGSGDQG